MKINTQQITNVCDGIRTFRNIQYYVAMVLGAGFLLIIYIRDPRVNGNFPTCPWLWLTGTHCPGCGTMRALHRLMHFDLMGALSYNTLTVVLIPVIAVTVISKLLPADFGGKHVDISRAPASLLYSLALVVLVFWFLRNLPWEPFLWLAPAVSR